MKLFVGRQSDLEQYSKFYGNQRSERSSGTLRANGGDVVTKRAVDSEPVEAL